MFECRCPYNEEVEEYNIPIIHTVMSSNPPFFGERKVKPSDVLKFKNITQGEILKIQKALAVLNRHNIYFFQEEN